MFLKKEEGMGKLLLTFLKSYKSVYWSLLNVNKIELTYYNHYKYLLRMTFPEFRSIKY